MEKPTMKKLKRGRQTRAGDDGDFLKSCNVHQIEVRREKYDDIPSKNMHATLML
jgi:hypothetical protein